MESTLKSEPLKKPGLRPVLGQISFVNCLPITVPLATGLVGIAADVFYAHPQELNRRYESGQLELGAMSSFYFLQSQDFCLVPNLAIASLGAVGSVLFFAKTKLADLRQIQVTAQSATSVNLLKVLLFEETGNCPLFSVVDRPSLDGDQHQGALVIGDQALSLDQTFSTKAERYDLGQWWHSRYQLPMVFGLWAARKSFAQKNPIPFQEISQGLRKACNTGLTSAFGEVLLQAEKRTALSQDRLKRYFQSELNFDLDQPHLKGLEHYRLLCRRYGLLA